MGDENERSSAYRLDGRDAKASSYEEPFGLVMARAYSSFDNLCIVFTHLIRPTEAFPVSI